ncbi:hypothetical protein ABIA39_002221 [Nocardia sp. GAS34]|uniref:hypothetical protein n=1 Tax=unclassified Nocardia TaxID=2637762 RepID=UPI003D203DA1
MIKNYARSFLPWIVFAVVSGFDVRAGAVAGLAAALILLINERRSGMPWDALILDISTGAYMLVIAVLACAAPHLAVLQYGTALSFGWLAVTAWFGLAIGRPFTTGIARRQVDEFIATTPLFRRINVVITTVWAICFTLDAVTLTVLQMRYPHATTPLLIAKFGFFVLAAVFTARYPDIARRRAGFGDTADAEGERVA